MILRESYLRQIERVAGSPVVKVLTGMRRSGKSTILRMYKEKLEAAGMPPENIVYIDMERLDFSAISDAKDLQKYVIQKTEFSGHANHKIALFVDEIQEIENWERAIASLLNKQIYDIFITGSNANLLSSELATKLTGRYVEIPVLPLTYAEYALFRATDPSDALFLEFIRRGGMPGIHHMEQDDETIRQYLESLVDSIVLKDIVKRYQVRDVDLLKRILIFLSSNSGKIFSARSVVDYLKKEKRSVGIETIYNYASYIVSAFLAHKATRYDVKGKRHLEVLEKYYFADLGIQNALCGAQIDLGAALETVVYFELKKRGYKVDIGKVGEAEVDFIAQQGSKKIYIQVCYLLADDRIIKREFSPLVAIADNHPKYVLSLDKLGKENFEGIVRLNLTDFLLGKRSV
jgi:predicted AAA+ superfamily ATPase